MMMASWPGIPLRDLFGEPLVNPCRSTAGTGFDGDGRHAGHECIIRIPNPSESLSSGESQDREITQGGSSLNWQVALYSSQQESCQFGPQHIRSIFPERSVSILIVENPSPRCGRSSQTGGSLPFCRTRVLH